MIERSGRMRAFGGTMPISGATHKATSDNSPVQPTARKSDQPPRHEDDHSNEDDPHRNEVILDEKAGEGLAQQQKKARADNWPYQCADAAHDVEDHRLAGNQEVDEIGRGEAVLN